MALGLFLRAACPASPFEIGTSAFRRGGIVANTRAPRRLQHRPQKLANAGCLPHAFFSPLELRGLHIVSAPWLANKRARVQLARGVRVPKAAIEPVCSRVAIALEAKRLPWPYEELPDSQHGPMMQLSRAG